jgi:hypothetical protein
MNVAAVVVSIVGIIIVLLWAWYRLKDAKQGDIVELVDGYRVEYSVAAWRIVALLFGLVLLLLMGLLV